jgi:hypothetical protein
MGRAGGQHALMQFTHCRGHLATNSALLLLRIRVVPALSAVCSRACTRGGGAEGRFAH